MLPGVCQLGRVAGWRLTRRGPNRRPAVGRRCPTQEDDAVHRETGGARGDEIQRGSGDLPGASTTENTWRPAGSRSFGIHGLAANSALHQSLRSTMDSHRKRSTLHRLSVVWPMNENHEGPVPPGMGRQCVDSTRYTTFLSMVAPNVRAMMRALRGQPNRGFRDLSSTMAWMSASLGPFSPGCGVVA